MQSERQNWEKYQYGTYNQRDRNIRTIGFKAYYTYLKSPLWRTIRKFILDRDEYLCQAKKCKNRATHVHHLAYTIRTLVGKTTGMLVSVCENCHKKCEFTDKGNKLRCLDARDKTFFVVTGLKKTNKTSDRDIGDWFKAKFKNDDGVTANKIRVALQEIPGVFERVEKWWLDSVKSSVWEAEPICKVEAVKLAQSIKVHYKDFAVIGVIEYKGTMRVHVAGPGGSNKIWTKAQLLELREKFIKDHQRVPR